MIGRASRNVLFVLIAAILLGSCAAPVKNTTEKMPAGTEHTEKIELKLWHIWTTDMDANRITLDAGMDNIQKAYPNIDFKVDATETETYKTRIKTAIAVNDAPDIFFTWGGGFSEALVNTGKVLCLDNYYTQEVESALPRKYLQYQTYNDSIYGFPFMRSYAIMYVNEKVFKDNNLEIPQTYGELLSVSKVLSEKGITTLAVAGQDMWPLMFHYATLAMRMVGPDTVKAALSGEESFTQEGFIEAGYMLLELKNAGAFGEDCLSMALDPLAASFKSGEGAMYYFGSWATGGFTAETKVANYIVPCAYPETGGEYDDSFLGGAVDCWMASVDSKYPDEAASVIIKLAQSISTIGGTTGMALPMWEKTDVEIPVLPGLDDADYLQIGMIYDKVAELTDGAGKDNSTLWWDTYLGKKGTRCNELIVQMFTGSITPEQFALKMDELVKNY